jgi:hypothetical protein
MGWWPFGKSSVDAKQLPKARQQQADEEQQRLAAAQAAGGTDAKGAALMPPMPRPTSIFEFGKPVAISSEHLVGMCAGDNPDAIQACTWTVEPLQGKAREKRPLYRIEF